MAVTYYCSIQDVRDALPTLTADVVGNQLIIRSVAWGQSLINSYLVKKYKLPFTKTPPLVNFIAVCLGVSFVTDPTHSGDGIAELAPFSSRKYKQAIDLLTALVDGTMSLIGEDGVAIPSFSKGIYMTNFDVNGTIPAPLEFDLYTPQQGIPSNGV